MSSRAGVVAEEDEPDFPLAESVEFTLPAVLRSDTSGVALVEEKAENLDEGAWPALGSSSLMCRSGLRAERAPRTLASLRGEAATSGPGVDRGGGVRPEREGKEDIESSNRAVSFVSSSMPLPKMGEWIEASKLGRVGNGGCDCGERAA